MRSIRDRKARMKICREAGVDLLFRPSPAEMYFADRLRDRRGELALGDARAANRGPDIFAASARWWRNCFNLLTPDAAVFGEKDFQQLAIIRRMVRDLNFPIEIIAVPTVREADGLACSSRNQYLNEDERRQAPVLRAALLEAANACAAERLQRRG